MTQTECLSFKPCASQFSFRLKKTEQLLDTVWARLLHSQTWMNGNIKGHKRDGNCPFFCTHIRRQKSWIHYVILRRSFLKKITYCAVRSSLIHKMDWVMKHVIQTVKIIYSPCPICTLLPLWSPLFSPCLRLPPALCFRRRASHTSSHSSHFSQSPVPSSRLQ